ncbi:hypothetical protein LFML04_2451 [Leptospirillum ferriphilum ML-04]|uniref:Uncharacterized protein n=1 Tax=Leptospirillum ferriphilum (strain ML-04) TaxID=1048260 RepID=J9ZD64_LEPFM|nr:hypothetical protein LFML04_2451 [Leptospirillum ferriphilum ML-04]
MVTSGCGISAFYKIASIGATRFPDWDPLRNVSDEIVFFRSSFRKKLSDHFS